MVRIGVVKVKDMSGQSLPTDDLRLNLISEIVRHQHEAIPLDAEGPHADVETEARAKQCDYILYTVPTQVKEPNSGGVPPASLPKGIVLDPAKFEALTDVTLYKVGKPTPELKNVVLAADAAQFAVDAVTATFVMESDRVDQQINEDAHPKRRRRLPRRRSSIKGSKICGAQFAVNWLASVRRCADAPVDTVPAAV